jgi:hypothetical protein
MSRPAQQPLKSGAPGPPAGPPGPPRLAQQARHIMIDGSGCPIHQHRPDAVAEGILQVIAQIRASQAQATSLPRHHAHRTPPAEPPHQRPGNRPTLLGVRSVTDSSALRHLTQMPMSARRV